MIWQHLRPRVLVWRDFDFLNRDYSFYHRAALCKNWYLHLLLSYQLKARLAYFRLHGSFRNSHVHCHIPREGSTRISPLQRILDCFQCLNGAWYGDYVSMSLQISNVSLEMPCVDLCFISLLYHQNLKTFSCVYRMLKCECCLIKNCKRRHCHLPRLFFNMKRHSELCALCMTQLI